jgi:HlyD family secretion protein
MSKWITSIIVIVLIGGCIAAGVWYARHSADAPTSFRTATVSRGDIAVTISASGTVEPEEVVDVGSQITGRIIDFGVDTNGKAIDYGSHVEKGKLLAHIDPTLFQADLAQAQAQLEANKAAVDRAKADLEQMKAKSFQAERDWQRAQKLGASDALSQVDYDAYQSAYEVAKAQVSVGEAAIKQAEKTVAQTEASMIRAKQNLDYTTILSPVDGVVIDRRVNIGQTVVSSLNASSLFLLAKDLKRMEVWVPVNEADIGSIKVGQPVSFTVDTYPNETFRGEVGKVRLNATMTQNVVTYVVEVVTDNSAGKLLPYLTANMSFQISKHEDVLMAPNAALRWTPKTEQIAPDARDAEAAAATQPSGGGRGRRGGGGAMGDGATSRPSRGGGAMADGATSRPSRGSGSRGGSNDDGTPRNGTLWVQDGTYVRPIHVRLGITDGVFTEILGDQVKEGTTLVTGETNPTIVTGPTPGGGSTGAGGNPFLPQMPQGGRGGGRGGGGR